MPSPETTPPRPWDQITDTTKESFATFERELRKNVADTHERYWFQHEPIVSLIANQEQLGRDFEKVLYENLEALYVRS